MVMRSAGVISMVVGILLLASSFDKRTDRELRSREANILVRDLGHQILLLSGDASSRVLPVKEIGEGIFQLRFEKDLAFTPDSLMALSKRILPESKFASGFILTVHDCIKEGIVYGFQVNRTKPDVLACRGREFPARCYLIEIAFPEFYTTSNGQKVGVLQSGNADNGNRTGQSLEVSGSENQLAVNDAPKDSVIAQLDSEVKDHRSAKEANSAKAENKLLYLGVVVLLLGAVVLFVRFRKNPKAINREVLQKDNSPKHRTHTTDLAQTENIIISKQPDHEVIAEQERASFNSDHLDQLSHPAQQQHQQQHQQPAAAVAEPRLPSLGKFLFDVKRQTLQSGNELIPLTDKECHVLELLHRDFGELVPRDTLMQEVWINEGVITGRSLDMFVSKLRKKLSSDDDLRITNVHGKGYRLESAPGMS